MGGFTWYAFYAPICFFLWNLPQRQRVWCGGVFVGQATPPTCICVSHCCKNPKQRVPLNVGVQLRGILKESLVSTLQKIGTTLFPSVSLSPKLETSCVGSYLHQGFSRCGFLLRFGAGRSVRFFRTVPHRTVGFVALQTKPHRTEPNGAVGFKKNTVRTAHPPPRTILNCGIRTEPPRSNFPKI